MSSSSDIITATLAGRRITPQRIDEIRWALQNAGAHPFEREAALVREGLIKPIQQDFGVMVEGVS